jgi:hypothetical protein
MTDIKGLKLAGNIDLKKRPVVKNDDGTISTVRSMSFQEDGLEVLIPTVSDDGRILDDEEAISLFHSTGRHLGKFDNSDDASAYAEILHQDQAKMYGEKPARDAWSGWNLPDARNLPNSRSAGPETWGEAWSKAAGATDDTMRLIENTNADYYGLEKAYDERIKIIADITGQTLPNPMREASAVDLDPDRAAMMAMSLGGGGTAFSSLDYEARLSREDEFNVKARALSGRYRQEVDQVLSTSVEEGHNQVMRDAEKAARDALMSPELGMAGRLGAQLAGGLKGAARDPTQWGMAMFGAGGAAGPTVAGRIGTTMVAEALLNGGQELLLQGFSQERKRQAGLEHGMGDMLQNAGVAAVFGSLFGGTIQGGAELARIYKMGNGGERIAARVLEGKPQPGDVEAVAKAMGVELSPEKLDLVNRSFEERVLDDYMVSSDATPAQLEVLQAAERYAADPDNFPPPEIIERMLAEQEAGRLLTMRPDDYERIYSGDKNAIDDIADTFFADDLAAATRAIDTAADAAPGGAVVPLARPDGVNPPDGVTVEPGPVASRSADAAADPVVDAEIRPRVTAEPFEDAAMRAAEERAGEISEPLRDLNGNPENYLDFIAIEDGDGVAKVMSVREALEMADEPDFLADVLEACKL